MNPFVLFNKNFFVEMLLSPETIYRGIIYNSGSSQVAHRNIVKGTLRGELLVPELGCEREMEKCRCSTPVKKVTT